MIPGYETVLNAEGYRLITPPHAMETDHSEEL